MTKITDILDIIALNDMREAGYIRQAKHPTLPLVSECYTKQTMFEKKWTNETRICRGLIWNTETLEVVARPFAKFFNWGEPSAPSVAPDTWFKAYNKLDGSLGIVYDTPDGPAVATKNSFVSPQAVHATEVLRTRYNGWLPQEGHTTLLEIIYPENRIVLDYGDLDDLFWLCSVDNRLGTSYWRQWYNPTFPEPSLLGVGPLSQLVGTFENLQRDNSEGVVLFSPDTDVRYKLKQKDYLELHKVATGLNKKQLWKWLSEGKSIDQILSDIPEELHDWALPIMQDLCTKFTDWDLYISGIWMEIRDEGWHEFRDLMAELTEDFPAWLRHGVFLLMDKDQKRYNQMIWRLVKPSGSK